MKRSRLIIPVFVFLLTMGLSTSASSMTLLAMFIDDLSTPGVDVIVVDNSPVATAVSIDGSAESSTHADGSGTVGAVSYTGGAGSWIVNVSTGLTEPVIGSPGLPQLDFNSINVSGGSGTLRLGLSAINLDGYSPILGFYSSIGGGTSGSLTYNSYLDKDNNQFGITSANVVDLFSSGVLNTNPFAASGSYAAFDTDPLFSLTQIVEITHSSSGLASSYNATLTAVPEPGTVMLLGFGLLGIGLFGRFRKQRNN